MSRILLALAASCLAIAVAVVVTGDERSSAAGTALAFAPSAQTVASSANGTVDVTVANVANLGNYDVKVSFNAAIIHITSMTDAGFIGSGSPNDITTCNPMQIDNTNGTASLVCGIINPFGVAVGGSTTTAAPLVHLAFTAVGAGTSPLSLTGSTLSDPANVPIAATLSSGSVTVGAAASVGGMAEIPEVAAAPAGHGTWLTTAWPLGIVATIAAGIVSLAFVRRR